MSFESLANKIPDLYFDWYARFIPGCVALSLYFIVSEKEFDPSAASLTLYAFIAYLCGHVIQPLSGRIIKTIEQNIQRDHEERYGQIKAFPEYSALVGKVSKAHAEANSMMASAILTLVILFGFKEALMLIPVAIYFVGAAIERSMARSRKIKDVIKCHEKMEESRKNRIEFAQERHSPTIDLGAADGMGGGCTGIES